MKAVIYFSCTGRSKALALNIAEKLGYGSVELTRQNMGEILNGSYENAVIVFPVHCQSYPAPMKKFFKNFKADYITLIATYGSADSGNAIYEAVKLLKKNPIAAAYVPCNHSYMQQEPCVGELPQEFIDKISSTTAVQIPKRRKTPFAGFLPSLRSRAIIKIKRNDNCDKCGKCNSVCPVTAVDNGKTNGRCIRCLKCVYSCPQGALSIKKSRVLTGYLRRVHCEDLIIYI